MVSKRSITDGLVELGLGESDLVVVHSSLSSFGKVEGGADAVVDAILEVIGRGGTLVVPTFTFGTGVFDADETPSMVGAVTESVRRRPDSLRSRHPSHSVAATGPLAEAIVEGHELTHAFGRASALYKVLQAGGRILQLGTTHTTNSMIHVAEEIAHSPYLDRQRQVEIRTQSGRIVRKWIRRPGCSRGFDVLDEPLLDADAISHVIIGDCRARLMTARAVVEAAVGMLKFDPTSLLCNEPDCGTCAESRAIVDTMESERQEATIRDNAEEDERLRRLVENRLAGEVKHFDSDEHFHSSN